MNLIPRPKVWAACRYWAGTVVRTSTKGVCDGAKVTACQPPVANGLFKYEQGPSSQE
jgi:hypothetical protein